MLYVATHLAVKYKKQSSVSEVQRKLKMKLENSLPNIAGTQTFQTAFVTFHQNDNIAKNCSENFSEKSIATTMSRPTS